MVVTIQGTIDLLRQMGHDVLTVTPARFRTIPCPTYPEIRLALFAGRSVAQDLDAFQPDAIHICTEGPLGLAARRYCVKRKLAFSTSLHTRFPEYVNLRLKTPVSWGYTFLRWFHGAAHTTMVATDNLIHELEEKGLRNMAIWSRGVNLDLFRPEARIDIDCPRPIFTYMGRVAVEKNLEAFLKLDLPGSKMIIGDGPELARYEREYPRVRFTGCKRGEELAGLLAAGDVFVFPSLTDTFGRVLIEANACGLPVAAFPVRGPADVLVEGVSGVMRDDLREAAIAALRLNRGACRDHARGFTWERCTEQFLNNLCPVR